MSPLSHRAASLLAAAFSRGVDKRAGMWHDGGMTTNEVSTRAALITSKQRSILLRALDILAAEETESPTGALPDVDALITALQGPLGTALVGAPYSPLVG